MGLSHVATTLRHVFGRCSGWAGEYDDCLPGCALFSANCPGAFVAETAESLEEGRNDSLADCLSE